MPGARGTTSTTSGPSPGSSSHGFRTGVRCPGFTSAAGGARESEVAGHGPEEVGEGSGFRSQCKGGEDVRGKCRSPQEAEVPRARLRGQAARSTGPPALLLQAGSLSVARRHKVPAGVLKLQGCGFPGKQGQGGQRGSQASKLPAGGRRKRARPRCRPRGGGRAVAAKASTAPLSHSPPCGAAAQRHGGEDRCPACTSRALSALSLLYPAERRPPRPGLQRAAAAGQPARPGGMTMPDVYFASMAAASCCSAPGAPRTLLGLARQAAWDPGSGCTSRCWCCSTWRAGDAVLTLLGSTATSARARAPCPSVYNTRHVCGFVLGRRPAAASPPCCSHSAATWPHGWWSARAHAGAKRGPTPSRCSWLPGARPGRALAAALLAGPLKESTPLDRGRAAGLSAGLLVACAGSSELCGRPTTT